MTPNLSETFMVGARQVVVTGLGPVTSIGTGVEPFWDAVLAGRSGTRVLDGGWMQRFRTRIGAPVPLPSPEALGITETEARLLDPAVHYAMAATRIALEDAGLAVDLANERRGQYVIRDIDPERTGVILGTGVGGLCTIERTHTVWTSGAPLLGPVRYAVPMLIPNAGAAQIAIRYGLHGECKAVTTACAAGAMAIGDAFRLIRDGELDIVVTGGYEKTLTDVDGYGQIGFDLLATLSRRNDEPERASRPFDKDRDGFVMSEGAGVVVLESAEHAGARGARVYCELAGYATTCDAHSMMQIDPSGAQLVRVMRNALRSAGLEPADIGYINAHGTSTRLNDAAEATAIRALFGRDLDRVLVNSTKAMTGHAIGASGAIEVITTALSLQRGVVHRAVNLGEPDPECDVPLPRQNATLHRRAAISNSFGFGGHNATLVLRTR